MSIAKFRSLSNIFPGAVLFLNTEFADLKNAEIHIQFLGWLFPWDESFESWILFRYNAQNQLW